MALGADSASNRNEYQESSILPSHCSRNASVRCRGSDTLPQYYYPGFRGL
jgi:hypothetical protein